MIQLFLVLCGTRVIRDKWGVLFGIGALWMLVGVFLFLDALDGALWIPIVYFTIPLALDCVWSLLSSLSASGVGRTLRLVKAAICFFVIALIVFAPRHSGLIIGILVGVFLCTDALWRGGSAWVVRYRGWKWGLFFAVLEFLFGAWSFVPWPTGWEGEVGLDVGTLLIMTAITMCTLAVRIYRLPHGVSILSVLNTGEPAFFIGGNPAFAGYEHRETGIVHVWTPTETVVSVNHGVSRYVAAADHKGVVSTGHAALELPPDLYISHYPAMEIDRSGLDFARALRATPDNDVPGLFQPSYTEESAGWCSSTMQIQLQGLNGRAIRSFWQSYSADTTYNLTSRNCASAVAKALDVGLEGLFAKKVYSPVLLLRFLLAPEFRVAGFMRRRAMAMAWTPGITLDYVRALRHLVVMLGPETGDRPAEGACKENSREGCRADEADCKASGIN